MKMTIDMPVVAECEVGDCVYNQNQACHARAITIGDMVNPQCDTFLKTSVRARAIQQVAGVGACKVVGCSHNHDFECIAANIHVGFAGDRVDCLTFNAR